VDLVVDIPTSLVWMDIVVSTQVDWQLLVKHDDKITRSRRVMTAQDQLVSSSLGTVQSIAMSLSV